MCGTDETRSLGIEVMASMFLNAPCNVGAIKHFDCKNYVGLRASSNQKLDCVGHTIKAPPRRRFIIRASERRDESMKKMGLTDQECEAAVVAGNVPEAPPVPPKPAAPAGTPSIPFLVSIYLFYDDFELTALPIFLA